MKKVGLIGARGYTGRQVLRLLAAHPDVDVTVACSASAAGRAVDEVFSDVSLPLKFTKPEPAQLAGLDAAILALPNGVSAPYVDAAAPKTRLIDLSADHRFDDSWTYGLVELHRSKLAGARRIANPGCYATAMQLAIAPFVEDLATPPHVFGVSGYSGAGVKPSRKNDPDVLRDNLLPYKLIDHVHEREASRHLGTQVRFMPHVASWFAGISLTVSMVLKRRITGQQALQTLQDAYRGEPLIEVVDGEISVAENAGEHVVRIGHVTADGERLVVVATIDNLLKGAATQAVQNLNLALGLDELAGIPLPKCD